MFPLSARKGREVLRVKLLILQLTLQRNPDAGVENFLHMGALFAQG
jgi:hypothetical protein